MADDYSDYTVSSEVNTFIAENNDSQESSRSDAVIVSRFTFSYPKGHKSVSVDLVSYAGSKYDEDGDLITSCSSDAAEQCQEDTLHIEHRMSTSLDMVGLQVWRGAFLLADYILHNYQLLQGQTIIELGSGTGLSGIVASMVAEKVVCTDINMGDILPLIRRNVDRNKRLLKNDVVVEELDFCKPFTSSMESHLTQATFVIVADVIYHDDLTDAFISTLQRILSTPPNKRILIALEKRYVFTITDLDSAAPCYEYFRTVLDELLCKQPQNYSWRLEQLPIDFPQYFCYERVKQLTLFELSSQKLCNTAS